MGILLFEGYALEAWITSVFLLFTFLGEFLSRRTLARARNRSKSKGSTTTVSMDENGVDIEGALGKSHLKWAALLPPAITPNGVLLRFSRPSGVWGALTPLFHSKPIGIRITTRKWSGAAGTR